MKTVKIFGDMEILTEDHNLIQNNKDNEIRKRVSDIFQNGIVNTATPFPITVNSGDHTKIDIGPGVAYNALGERIEIFSGESVVADTQVATVTVGLYTWPLSLDSSDAQIQAQPIPYSTGNVGISLYPSYAAAVTNYIFIDRVDTLADLNHYDASTDNYTWGDWNSRNTKYSTDQETGIKMYPYKKNGYRIIMEATPTCVAVQANGSYIHNLYPNAVYIGSVKSTGIGLLTSANIDIDNSTIRQKFLQNYKTVGIYVPATTSEATATYNPGSYSDLKAHIAAVGSPSYGGGSGIVSANNPHGQTIYDLGYTGQDMTTHRNEEHTAFIINGSTPVTSNISLLYPVIDGSALTTIHLYMPPGDWGIVSGGKRFSASDIASANSVTTGIWTHTYGTGGNRSVYIYIDNSGKINTDDTVSLAQIIANDYLLICTMDIVGGTGEIVVPGTVNSGVIDRRTFGSISTKNINSGANQQGASLIPVGAIMQFLGVSDGWLELKGQTISYDPSSVLATVTGVQYYDLVQYLRNLPGSPFISVTSTSCAVLPDMRNKFPIGVDAGAVNGSARVLGVGGGSHTISLVAANIPHHAHVTDNPGDHAHRQRYYVDGPTSDHYPGYNYATNEGGTTYNTWPSGAHTHSMVSTNGGTAVSGSSVTTTPPFVPMYFCIKY